MVSKPPIRSPWSKQSPTSLGIPAARPDQPCSDPGGRGPRGMMDGHATRPHRLVAKDITLSRWRHGFESRWGCSKKGQVRAVI